MNLNTIVRIYGTQQKLIAIRRVSEIVNTPIFNGVPAILERLKSEFKGQEIVVTIRETNEAFALKKKAGWLELEPDKSLNKEVSLSEWVETMSDSFRDLTIGSVVYIKTMKRYGKIIDITISLRSETWVELYLETKIGSYVFNGITVRVRPEGIFHSASSVYPIVKGK